LDEELFAECAESAFQLVEPGSAPEIEQAIYFHAQHLQLMLDAWAARNLPWSSTA
jgi:hypothetical protein